MLASSCTQLFLASNSEEGEIAYTRGPFVSEMPVEGLVRLEVVPGNCLPAVHVG